MAQPGRLLRRGDEDHRRRLAQWRSPGGYYDEATKTIVVASDLTRADFDVVLAACFSQALDDQAHDLAALRKRPTNDDESFAIEATIQGASALVASIIEWRNFQSGSLAEPTSSLLVTEQNPDARRLAGAPPAAHLELEGPYVLGRRFLLKGEPSEVSFRAEAVDQALADPPTSTEQLMHPEEYWTASPRVVPRAVSLPDQSAALGDGWRLDATGRLGAAWLTLLAHPSGPFAWQPRAAYASVRWRGDGWQLYRNGERSLVVLATHWADEGAASALAASVDGLPAITARRNGTTVVFVAGTDSGPAAELADAALAKLGEAPE